MDEYERMDEAARLSTLERVGRDYVDRLGPGGKMIVSNDLALLLLRQHDTLLKDSQSLDRKAFECDLSKGKDGPLCAYKSTFVIYSEGKLVPLASGFKTANEAHSKYRTLVRNPRPFSYFCGFVGDNPPTPTIGAPQKI
jgi:hypothetical protein